MRKLSSSRHVVLLRGINVGGKNRLPMKELVEDFEAAGAQSVRTYIQSGNVLFTSPKSRVPEILRTVAKRLAERGLDVPLVTRTAAEFEQAVLAQPYPDSPSEALHIGFLTGKPTAPRTQALDPERSPGDQFTVSGREIYLLCPNGMARTKLTSAFFDRGLQLIVTFRNWKTTLKVLELLREP